MFAKSFARIHRRNLVAQGIPALTFKDAADYDRAAVGQTWVLPRIKQELQDGVDEVTVRIEETGDEFAVTHDLAPKERDLLVEGGLLHWLQRHGEQVSANGADGAGDRAGRTAGSESDQRQEDDAGGGGRTE